MDLLLIVDDSPAAEGLRATWAPLWPALAAQLEDPTSSLSLHVLASSATGCGQPSPCSDDGTGYLSSTVCGSARNFQGSLADGFGCLAAAPLTTCADARPLEQLYRFAALPVLRNAGFLRDGAAFAVLILAASDDASEVMTDAIIRALADVRPYFGLDAVVAIGPGNCSGEAMATAPRLAAAMDQLDGRYIAQCSPSWMTDALASLSLPRRTGTVSCLGPLRDADPARPGLQPLVRVFDTSTSQDDTSRSGELSSCADSPPPCWNWEVLPVCPSPQGLFSVTRPKGFCPRLVRTVVDFATCASPDDPDCAANP